MKQYKVGDKVRILPREGDDRYYPFTYANSMEAYAGNTMTIKDIRPMSAEDIKEFSSRSKYNGDENAYILEEDEGCWTWHSSMFVKAGEEEDPIAYKIADVKVNNKAAAVMQSRITGRYYIQFIQNHAEECRALHDISDFCTLARDFNALNYGIVDAFPTFPDYASLLEFLRLLGKAPHYDKTITDYFSLDYATSNKGIVDEEIINEILNTQDYENRLQKSKTSIRRGDCPKGREISCGKNKTTVSVGHLSYRKCHC